MTAGCQLLIDNRQTGKASVVVVPTDEWDKLRGQQMRTDIARDMAKDMATSIADELLIRSKPLLPPPRQQKRVLLAIKTPMRRHRLMDHRLIQFSNRTNSQLAGCSNIGIIEVRCIPARSTMP